ncbi:MAG: hypothetical protein Q9195_008957 [Heterodermia aff. obscurata]
MPMIMEDDLDDLFRDAPSLHIARPLPRALTQRVDVLRLVGCRQRIAWSILGCIAYISDDGCGVCCRHLYCKPTDAQWSLSEELPINGVSLVHGNVSLVNLSWNQLGNELVIFDSLGKVSIFSITTSLCEFSIPKKCVLDVEDQLNEVVGLVWLNTDKPQPFHPPAQKKEGRWKFSARHHKALGPHNPLGGGSALVTSRAEIEKVTSPSELIDHATLCAHRDSTMLLATHTCGQQLMLYRITFNFQQRIFDIQRLKTLSNCFPKDISLGNPDLGETSASVQLTHLEYFPQGPENLKGDPSRPFVLAAFTSLPDTGHTHHNQEPYSILSKKSNSSLPDLPMEVTVKRLPDTYIPKVFLHVQQLRLSTILAIAFSDGSIEVRDRHTMEVISQDDVVEQVSGLDQIGFEFPQDRNQYHIALSPNACAAVSFADKPDIHLRLIQMPPHNSIESLDKCTASVILVIRGHCLQLTAFYEAAAEAFTLCYSTACASYGSYQDDIVAAIQTFSKQHPHGNIERNFLGEICRVLDVRLDHSVEPQLDYLFKNSTIQRCLSMQLSLGFLGKCKSRTLPAKVAHALLDIRATTLVMTYTLRSMTGAPNPEHDQKKQQEIEARKSDELQAITGPISWYVSLMNYIVDELFQLSDAMRDHGSMDNDHLNTLIHTSSNPSLPLLLISTSRTFLRYLSRHFSQFKQAGTTAGKTPFPHSSSYACIGSILRDAPLHYEQFERLLAQLNTDIQNAYQASGIAEAQRKETEKEMLIQGTVPAVLMPAVETLLGQMVAALKEEVDVARLYFMDFSWLEMGEDRKTGLWMRGKRLDVVRKVVVEVGGEGGRAQGKQRRLKRCTRCCAVMEDVGPGGGFGGNGQVLHMQRNCFCGGWWMGIGVEREG